MCELLGMSANVPTDLCFSFAGLRRRGGGTGPHKDGWGVVFYEGAGIRAFHDPNPSVSSEVADLLERHPIRSTVAICHIRQANVGGVSLANTHPFIRELGGRYWSFAHNGQLHDYCWEQEANEYPVRHRPVGDTDSEGVFCALLNRLSTRIEAGMQREALLQTLASLCAERAQRGVFNVILSNGDWLFSFCSTRLSVITRRAPFRPALLQDSEVCVQLPLKTSPLDVITVVATEPLTLDSAWQALAPGEWRAWASGEEIGRGRVAVPQFSHPTSGAAGKASA